MRVYHVAALGAALFLGGGCADIDHQMADGVQEDVQEQVKSDTVVVDPDGVTHISCYGIHQVRVDFPSSSMGELISLKVFERYADYNGAFASWRGPVSYVVAADGSKVLIDCPDEQGFGAEVTIYP